MRRIAYKSTDNNFFNALTVDVEDYYMVSAFSDVVKFEDWHKHESRVENSTHKILDLFEKQNVKATFFVLGWVAEHYPNLVREIYSGGHEIACHGYNHRLIYHLTHEQFRDDVHTAKCILEDIIGAQILGYRAASYSIVKRTIWALDILIEEGFVYDSSIFPVYHDRYGFPAANRFPHMIQRKHGTIKEFPPSTFKILGQNIPMAGGGYLRLLPSQITRSMIKRINMKDKQPVTIYVHPWEVDADQPRLNGCLKSKFRHYVNLRSTFPKLRCFLDEFRFRPLSSFLGTSMECDSYVSQYEQ